MQKQDLRDVELVSLNVLKKENDHLDGHQENLWTVHKNDIYLLNIIIIHHFITFFDNKWNLLDLC